MIKLSAIMPYLLVAMSVASSATAALNSVDTCRGLLNLQDSTGSNEKIKSSAIKFENWIRFGSKIESAFPLDLYSRIALLEASFVIARERLGLTSEPLPGFSEQTEGEMNFLKHNSFQHLNQTEIDRFFSELSVFQYGKPFSSWNTISTYSDVERFYKQSFLIRETSNIFGESIRKLGGTINPPSKASIVLSTFNNVFNSTTFKVVSDIVATYFATSSFHFFFPILGSQHLPFITNEEFSYAKQYGFVIFWKAFGRQNIQEMRARHFFSNIRKVVLPLTSAILLSVIVPDYLAKTDAQFVKIQTVASKATADHVPELSNVVTARARELVTLNKKDRNVEILEAAVLEALKNQTLSQEKLNSWISRLGLSEEKIKDEIDTDIVKNLSANDIHF